MNSAGPSNDELVSRFRRLIRELISGEIKRNTFQPWEIEILLDIESCNLRQATLGNVLKRYERAVLRRLEQGETKVMKLSEFLRRKS